MTSKFKVLPWGNQTQAILDLSAIPTHPIYLHEYWEDSQDFLGGFSTTLERNFFWVRNFCRPPETPLMAEISASESIVWGKKFRGFSH